MTTYRIRTGCDVVVATGNDTDETGFMEEWFIDEVRVGGLNKQGRIADANGNLGYVQALGALATAATTVYSSKVTGDAFARYEVRADGTELWGSGAAPLDTTLVRHAAAALRLTGAFYSSTTIAAAQGGANEAAFGAVGTGGTAGLALGSAATDVIYRSAAGQIKTDGIFRAVGYIIARDGNPERVSMGNFGPANEAGVEIGATSPGTIFQAAASTLRTNAEWHFGNNSVVFRWINAGQEQATVGAAGAASALPATPSKFIKVKGTDGTNYVLPAYLAA